MQVCLRFYQGLILLFTISLLGCFGKHTHYQGYIEGEYIYLASGFSGTLKQLDISRGAEVKKGQLLEEKLNAMAELDKQFRGILPTQVIINSEGKKEPVHMYALDCLAMFKWCLDGID